MVKMLCSGGKGCTVLALALALPHFEDFWYKPTRYLCWNLHCGCEKTGDANRLEEILNMCNLIETVLLMGVSCFYFIFCYFFCLCCFNLSQGKFIFLNCSKQITTGWFFFFFFKLLNKKYYVTFLVNGTAKMTFQL